MFCSISRFYDSNHSSATDRDGHFSSRDNSIYHNMSDNSCHFSIAPIGRRIYDFGNVVSRVLLTVQANTGCDCCMFFELGIL